MKRYHVLANPVIFSFQLHSLWNIFDLVVKFALAIFSERKSSDILHSLFCIYLSKMDYFSSSFDLFYMSPRHSYQLWVVYDFLDFLFFLINHLAIGAQHYSETFEFH